MQVPSEAGAPDPFLGFMAEWEAAEKRFNALPNGLSDEAHEAGYDAILQPYNRRAARGEMPDATTKEGAAKALREILKYGDIEGQPQDYHLLKVALAYLEGRA